jgi:MoaA/NifB/PqqE/SkfB family radical SAM enzyme
MRAVSSGPAHVTFLLGYGCNAHCLQCFHRAWRAPAAPTWSAESCLRRGTVPLVDLPIQDVVEVLALYSMTLRAVSFGSFGEPMLHPAFGAIIAHVAAHQPAGGWDGVGLLTNGSLLQRCMELGDLPGCLTVSVDAGERNLYEHIRYGLSFDVLRQNLLAFCTRKNHPQRRVGLSMTVFSENVAAIYDTASFAVSVGAAYFNIHRAVCLDESLAKGGEVARDDPRVAAQIARARSDFPWLQIGDCFARLDGLPSGAVREPCNAPWSDLYVFNDGSVHTCCRAVLALGHWRRADQWHGAVMSKLRKQIETGEIDANEYPDCFGCPLR